MKRREKAVRQESLDALQHHIESAERRVAEQSACVEKLGRQGDTDRWFIAEQLLHAFEESPDLYRHIGRYQASRIRAKAWGPSNAEGPSTNLAEIA